MGNNPFEPTGLTFEEYKNQDVVDTGDGEFFDYCDTIVGVVPRTDKLNPDYERTDSQDS